MTKNKIPKQEKEKQTNYLPLALLAIIIILGFSLRIHHIDYPVIGYHNWKQTHYLTEARNFAEDGFFTHGFFVPEVDYPRLGRHPSGAHADTFPTISILVAFMFKIFGTELWAARIVGILCTTLAIPLMYLLTKQLFNREDMALITALLTATSPLIVFFSHNVQLINPGILFMISSAYFYTRWRTSFKDKELILMVLSLTIATITKYPFLIIAIPMFATFPFRRIVELKNQWRGILISLIIISAIPLWFLYAENTLTDKFGGGGAVSSKIVDLGLVFSSTWQETQKHYIADNYTHIGFYMAILGGVFLLLFFDKKSFGDKFLLAYLLGSIVFVVVMAYKIGGHSYHHYPVAPLIILLMGYFIVRAGDGVGRLRVEDKGVPHINVIVMVVLLGMLISPVQVGISRQFDTQFIGLDVAGEYVKENSNKSEKIMFPSHQSYGILWHADRKGYATPGTVEDIKKVEDLGGTWVFVYQWGFKIQENKECWEYLKSNYHLRQAAYVNTGEGASIMYILLRNGGNFTEGDVSFDPVNVKHRDYEFSVGEQRLNYVDFE